MNFKLSEINAKTLEELIYQTSIIYDDLLNFFNKNIKSPDNYVRNTYDISIDLSQGYDDSAFSKAEIVTKVRSPIGVVIIAYSEDALVGSIITGSLSVMWESPSNFKVKIKWISGLQSGKKYKIRLEVF